MHSIGYDANAAFRAVRRAPAFTATAVFTLALGIGANSVIFSVINGVLLKPLPFENPHELVGIWHTAPGLGFDEINQSPATYFTYREESRVFDEVGNWDDGQVSVIGKEHPEQVDALYVTDGTLPALRINPFRGRAFTAEDDTPRSPRTVMLSHGYWQSRWGGDPAAIGGTVIVDGRAHEIIGILPADFRFLRFDPALVLPLRLDRSQTIMGNFSYQGLARLKPGIDLETANRDVSRMIPLAAEKFPGGISLEKMLEAGFAPQIRPLRQDAIGNIGSVLWILLGTVGLVLLVACANVANLFLVRAEGRQRELAVRSALGARPARIVRSFLLESVILGVVGGAVGLMIAFGGIRLLVALRPQSLPRLEDIAVNPLVMAFTLAISVAAGLVFGILPAIKFASPRLQSSLKEGGRGGGHGRERHRTRNLLVASQIALALVLLVASGLMIRSFQALRKVEPGFQRPEEVLTLRIPIPSAEVSGAEEVVLTYRGIAERIGQIPGVESVGLTSSVTLGGQDSSDAVYVEDFPSPENALPPVRRFKWVSEGYFGTMGNPVLAGRRITWEDAQNRARVVVVTENLAREYWGEPAAALGKRLRPSLGDEWREIVGVVGNIHDDGLDQKAVATIYWPMLVENLWFEGLFVRRSMVFAIRSPRVGTAGFVNEIRSAIWSVNPNLAIANVRTLQSIFESSLARTTFTLIMLGVAACVALILGSVGIYAVISYAVSQRTREIGVRMALGARRTDVSRMVLRNGLALTFVGVAVGLVAAAALTRLMSTLLFGVSPVDPITFGVVSGVLAIVALTASYLPARRAAGVDPIESLRCE